MCVLFSLIFVCQTSEQSHAVLATVQTYTQYNILYWYKNNIPYTVNRVKCSSTNAVNSIILSYYCDIVKFHCTVHVRSTRIRLRVRPVRPAPRNTLDGSAPWAIRLRRTANCTSCNTMVRLVRETICRRHRRPTDSLPVYFSPTYNIIMKCPTHVNGLVKLYFNIF